MPERIEALINPKMLIWARHKGGYDINGAAKRIGVKPERLQEWESGALRPSIIQAYKIAEVYHRPLSVFYLNDPPKDFSVALTDFRRLPETEVGVFSPGLIREIQLAESRREIMLELTENEEDGNFSLNNSITLNSNITDIAQDIRTLLNVSWGTQQKWHTPNDALNGWKEAIEKLNVLVFQSNPQGISFSPLEAHGFSLSEYRFPTIVINSKDFPRRRIFTLLHEFIHLLINAGGICDNWEYFNVRNTKERTESFCNHVAGAVLVPESLLLTHNILRTHERQGEWSDEEIRTLADDFSTSQEVIVRRLLTTGIVTPQYYEIKRIEYLQAWHDNKEKLKNKQSGFAPQYRMVMKKNGKPFTRLIIHAYYDKKITLSDVSDYLETKIVHVKRIEQELFNMATGD